MTDVWGDDEETLGEMAERFGRRAVVAVAEAENARLRAQLEAVRNECERGWVRAANADASRRVIDVDRILAAFSNEGGDDG